MRAVNFFCHFQSSQNSSSCSLCNLGFEEGEELVGHQTNTISHLFHRVCITRWFQNETAICPKCHYTVKNSKAYLEMPESSNFEERLENALKEGDLEAVQDILLLDASRNLWNHSSLQDHLQYARYWAGLKAVQNKQHKASRSLLLGNGPLSEEERGWAVYYAAKSRDLKRVQAFLADGPISQSKRGFALWTIAEDQNSLPIAEALLESGPISKEDLVLAMKKAKQNPPIQAALQALTSQCAIS